jgi:phytol kinase
MTQLVFPLIWLGGCFLLLFGLAEWMHLKLHVKPEITRKMVHIGTGLLALLFPVFLTRLWQVGILCAGFLIILLISKKKLFLSSINKIDRKSQGSILYPVAVFCCFAVYLFVQKSAAHFQPYYYFFLPVLLLAICDPIAAFSGNWYKIKNNIQPGKTFAGSVAFFLSAFVLAYLLQQYFSISDITTIQCINSSVFIAFITTVTERISANGWDNLSIPFITILCVQVLEQVA